MFKDFLDEIRSTKISTTVDTDSDRMNQKEAAKFLGITEATLIRWKKKGSVPYDQVPGSNKNYLPQISVESSRSTKSNSHSSIAKVDE
jgi:hypothetical protein